MTWPWRRHVPADRPNPAKAQRELEETRRQWPEIHRVVGEVKEELIRNHIAERLELSFGRHRDG